MIMYCGTIISIFPLPTNYSNPNFNLKSTVMKSKILALACLVIFSLVSVKNLKADEPVKRNLKSIIEKRMDYPSRILEDSKNATVLVDLQVNNNGKLEISKISAPNERLKQYVIQRLRQIGTENLKGIEPNVIQTYRIEFRAS